MRVLLPVDRRRRKDSDSSSDSGEYSIEIDDCSPNSAEDRSVISFGRRVDTGSSEDHEEPIDKKQRVLYFSSAPAKQAIESTYASRHSYGDFSNSSQGVENVKDRQITRALELALITEKSNLTTESHQPALDAARNENSSEFAVPVQFHCAATQREGLRIRRTPAKRSASPRADQLRTSKKLNCKRPAAGARTEVPVAEFVSATSAVLRTGIEGEATAQASSPFERLVGPPTKPLAREIRPDESCRTDTDLTSLVSFGGQDLSLPLLEPAPVVVSCAEITRPEENPGNSTTIARAMAVGGRPRSEDDEDSCAGSGGPTELHAASPRLPWTHPVENEPPIFRNHPPVPFTLQVVNHQGTPDPASDDERDLPESPVSRGDLAATPKYVDVPIAAKHNRHAASNLAMARLCEALKAKGLEIVEQEGDGNCLFRAVSLQVYGSADNHGEVRERCMDFMARNEEHYGNFVAIGSCDTDADAIPESRADTAFQDYIARKRINGVHGNHAEIQAISELFNRPVEVYTPPAVNDIGQPDSGPLQPMNFHAEYKTSDPPIRLSFHDGNHYNAIIDPLVPTAGLGLGLPGLKPGLADQMQVTKAKAESDRIADEVELQRVLKESHEEKDAELQRVLQETSMDYMYHQKATALTDVEATNYEIEQKVLANSMESYFRQEQDRKQKASSPVYASSAGRRRRGSPSPATDEPIYSSFASIPSDVSASVSASAVASLPSVASSAEHPESAGGSLPSFLSTDEEYPQTVQELVMNGFELEKVIRAYEFIGDHFDDLLSFLLSFN